MIEKQELLDLLFNLKDQCPPDEPGYDDLDTIIDRFSKFPEDLMSKDPNMQMPLDALRKIMSIIKKIESPEGESPEDIISISRIQESLESFSLHMKEFQGKSLNDLNDKLNNMKTKTEELFEKLSGIHKKAEKEINYVIRESSKKFLTVKSKAEFEDFKREADKKVEEIKREHSTKSAKINKELDDLLEE